MTLQLRQSIAHSAGARVHLQVFRRVSTVEFGQIFARGGGALLQVLQSGVGARRGGDRPFSHCRLAHRAQPALGDGRLLVRIVQGLGLAFHTAQHLVFFTLKRHDAMAHAKVFHLAALGFDFFGKLGDFIIELSERCASRLSIAIRQLLGLCDDQLVDQRCRDLRVWPAR